MPMKIEWILNMTRKAPSYSHRAILRSIIAIIMSITL